MRAHIGAIRMASISMGRSGHQITWMNTEVNSEQPDKGRPYNEESEVSGEGEGYEHALH